MSLGCPWNGRSFGFVEGFFPLSKWIQCLNIGTEVWVMCQTTIGRRKSRPLRRGLRFFSIIKHWVMSVLSSAKAPEARDDWCQLTSLCYLLGVLYLMPCSTAELQMIRTKLRSPMLSMRRSWLCWSSCTQTKYRLDPKLSWPHSMPLRNTRCQPWRRLAWIFWRRTWALTMPSCCWARHACSMNPSWRLSV